MLLSGGCAHRVRLAAPPLVGPTATKSAVAGQGGARQMRDAIGKLRESLRRNKRSPAEEPASSTAVDPAESLSGTQPVGTSGKWVVTTTTEREKPQVTSSTTQTVQRPRPQLALVGQTIRRGWPLLLAGLAIVACVVALRRSVRRSSQNS